MKNDMSYTVLFSEVPNFFSSSNMSPPAALTPSLLVIRKTVIQNYTAEHRTFFPEVGRGLFKRNRRRSEEMGH